MPATSANPANLIALHDLYGRLAHAWDSGSGERFVKLCTDDIELRGNGETVAAGRSQVAGLANSVAKAHPGLRHMVSSIYVDIDGDEAVGHAYVEALRPTEEGLNFGGLVEYEDTFVRIEGVWTLRLRKFARLAPAAAHRPIVLAPK